MKKFSDLVKRSGSKAEPPEAPTVMPSSEGKSPETYIVELIAAFSESGNPKKAAGSVDETVCLTEIVTQAEASPSAARRAAIAIKDALKKKKSKPYERYNAIMLIEILAKNPGKPFLEGLAEEEVVETFKNTLRTDSDPSVQSSLRDALGWIGSQRANDPDVRDQLKPLMSMWRHEDRRSRVPGTSSVRTLPAPEELARRISEAIDTAKLLRDTARANMTDVGQDYIRDLAERTRNASWSIQGFCHSTNPYPDSETMKTLIETYGVLNTYMMEYLNILLEARKRQQAMEGRGQRNGQPQAQSNGSEAFAPPAGPPPPQKPSSSSTRPSGNTANAAENPFADTQQTQSKRRNNYTLFGSGSNSQSNSQSNLQQPLQPQKSTQPTQTPSYVARQESASNNITMHGASPPPDETVAAR